MGPDDYILTGVSEKYFGEKGSNKWVYFGMLQDYQFKSESTGMLKTETKMTEPVLMRQRDTNKYNPKSCFKKGNR